jgi:GH35 family endo-1,4-beta-xylanase
MFKFTKTFSCLTLSALCLSPLVSEAQISTNKDKFLGNITTRYQMDAGGGVPAYYKLWNQVTPENESKWGSVEGTRNKYNWGCDTPFNYAKNHNFTYKFHALVWGSQYPDKWFNTNLSVTDRFIAIENWYNQVKKKYNHLPMIDVVNEAIDGHQDGNPLMKESLGGGGKTGYDWLIKAFEMAYERFPNSILIYNDFNTFQWNTDQFITLVQAIRDGGAPIDAYGCQSHDLKGFGNLPAVDKKIQNALLMPMYITEYDIQEEDDQKQLNDYKNQIPYLWERDYCAGITLWGYVYGATWNEGTSGIYKNGQERAAMTWLKEYMATDAAKNAKSPFPGMKKRVGVYIKAKDFKMAKGDTQSIKVRTFITDDAKSEKADIAIDSVKLYDGTTLIAKMTEEPYIAEYTGKTAGTRTLKAVVYTNDEKTYERTSRITVQSSTIKREPYHGEPVSLPGVINAAEFDKGASGVTYSNAPFNYSTRASNSATKANGWMEYTVDVKETGLYQFDAEVAAAKTGGAFHISEYGLDDLTFYTSIVEVPATGAVDNFQELHGVFRKELTAGRHTLCLNTDKAGFYIRNIRITPYAEDNTMTCTVSRTPTTVTVGNKTTITVNASSKTSTIAQVNVYANGLLIGTLTEAPYTLEYEPIVYGKQQLTAIAVDAEGRSKTSSAVALTVDPKREPYAGVISIPGTLQAENYDVGGEGYSYHDTSTANEGDANFRTNDGVDVVKGNNGKAIGYTEADEWMEYTVNVKETGKYTCEAVVSSGVTGSKFIIQRVLGSSKTLLATINVPQTANNDWGTYKSVTQDISTTLSAGEHVLRITIKGKQCNIDKLIFTVKQSTGIDDIEADGRQSAPIYNLKGQKVSEGYKGFVIRNGRKVLKR